MEKVSIIIPVYNRKNNKKGSAYLKESIDSALSQTYENIEVIVVNDGSEDDGATEAVALSYGNKIRYYSKENGGVSSALNFGIQHSSGEWISWLSHDDLYTNDKIAEQMNDVENLKASNKDYRKTMYYCLGSFIVENGNATNKKTKKLPKGLYVNCDILYKMFHKFNIAGCGLLIPKNMFDEVGRFDEDMKFSQDTFMWTKAFVAGYGLYVNDKIMSITRIHNMQTSTMCKEYKQKDREKIAKYLLEKLDGMVDSKKHDLLKEYLFMCVFKGIRNGGANIYKYLDSCGRITFSDKCRMKMLKIKGGMRNYIANKYYKIRYGVCR